MTRSYHSCERCSFAVYPGEGVVCWDLDGKEHVVHECRSTCEYLIRTDPDACEPVFVPAVSLKLVEVEHRSTGALDPERGLWR